jgi:hypothetical protein
MQLQEYDGEEKGRNTRVRSLVSPGQALCGEMMGMGARHARE